MRKWEPSSNDATAFAAFRWFANTIENDALELYATDRRHFPEIERVLRETLKELKRVRESSALRSGEEEGGCPDGWVLCDGICKPSCDGIE
jgi:hypothetical protein